MRGLPGRTSERGTAKSTAIKGRGGKSGGDAVKAVGLTSGGLRRVRKSRTEQGLPPVVGVQAELLDAFEGMAAGRRALVPLPKRPEAPRKAGSQEEATA